MRRKDESTLDDYQIGPEDVLAVSVWKTDVMNRVVSVRPDGMISAAARSREGRGTNTH
jgi:hypothetical protein